MAVKLGRKQNYKNLSLNIVAFLVQFIVNFYISPIIVGNVGKAAYGFIGVANDFVAYASIIATIFNSVASRFIANSYYKKDYERANKYFNSFVAANIGIGILLAIVTVILVPFLNHILTIPEGLVFDVQLTFILVFATYVINLLIIVLTTSTFVTNRTDINGVRNVIQYIIRFALVIVFLNFVSIKIYWVALASFIAALVGATLNATLFKRLTPELSFNLKDAKRSYVFELAKSGCWMALISISSILLRGLDLTVANIMIGDDEMGILSIARTFPNSITGVISVLAPLFTPTFISFFAKGDSNGLVKDVNRSIKTMASIMFVPITCFIIFSFDFYTLWQSSLKLNELIMVTSLSIITVVQAYFNSTTATMAQLSVVVNKLRIPVLVSVGCGVVSLVAEILLIKFTGLGLYAIVIPTTIVMVCRYVFFNSIYAAYCIDKPKKTFFPAAIKTWISIPILLSVMYVIRLALPVSSWITLAIDIAICCVIGYIFIVFVYNRDLIKIVFNKVKARKQ